MGAGNSFNSSLKERLVAAEMQCHVTLSARRRSLTSSLVQGAHRHIPQADQCPEADAHHAREEHDRTAAPYDTHLAQQQVGPGQRAR